MLSNLGTLLYCPNCVIKGHHVAIGSITAQGYVVIKMRFGKRTMIIADTFSIVCECGYALQYAEGKISPSVNGNDYHEETN